MRMWADVQASAGAVRFFGVGPSPSLGRVVLSKNSMFFEADCSVDTFIRGLPIIRGNGGTWESKDFARPWEDGTSHPEEMPAYLHYQAVSRGLMRDSAALHFNGIYLCVSFA